MSMENTVIWSERNGVLFPDIENHWEALKDKWDERWEDPKYKPTFKNRGQEYPLMENYIYNNPIFVFHNIFCAPRNQYKKLFGWNYNEKRERLSRKIIKLLYDEKDFNVYTLHNRLFADYIDNYAKEKEKKRISDIADPQNAVDNKLDPKMKNYHLVLRVVRFLEEKGIIQTTDKTIDGRTQDNIKFAFNVVELEDAKKSGLIPKCFPNLEFVLTNLKNNPIEIKYDYTYLDGQEIGRELRFLEKTGVIVSNEEKVISYAPNPPAYRSFEKVVINKK